MLDSLRRSLRDLLNGPAAGEDHRDAVARMRDTLVAARVGLSDLRTALDTARRRLAAEREELETVQRRKRFAAEIGDGETVAIAERYERLHSERVAVLEGKVRAQEAELMLAEREVSQMTDELKAAAVRAKAGPAASRTFDSATLEDVESQLRDELDQLDRSRVRAAGEAEAERRLAEIKRRMGK